MNTRMLASAATAVILTACPLMATSASAAASGTDQVSARASCVSKADYRKARRGMTMAKVHKIWGTKGHHEAGAHSGGYASEVRSYRGCGSPYNSIAASFSKSPGGVFKMDAKSAVWIS